MKKRVLSLLVLFSTLFTACTAKEKTEKGEIGTKKDGVTVLKIGTTGTDTTIWDIVNENLKDDKIRLENVVFEDYIKPNLALSNKEIDLNAFQHSIFLEDFKKKHNLDISILNYTVVAPMGFFSKKIKSIDEIKENSKVAIPNDATNGGRALRILEKNSLLKLKKESGLKPTVKDILENPKNLQIIELSAQQIPRSLDEVDFAAINSGIAGKAKLKFEDAIIKEDPKSEDSKNYWNLIAVRTKDLDNEVIKKVKNAYLKQNVYDKVKEVNGDGSIVVFTPEP